MATDAMIERFVKYVKVDTQAKQDQDKTPSSEGQKELAKIVYDDLKNAGLEDLELTDEAFIYATIPANLPDSHPAKDKIPTIGLLAHLDTAPDAPGKDIKPQFIENYQGDEIKFPANDELILSPKTNPKLKKYIGKTLITSDGTTLLGGDDKAGLAIMVELANHYKDNPDDLHGKIRLAVIPDEEIGIGAEKLDLEKFGADFAYTLDGGEIGEIDVESFNGYRAKVEIKGNPAFPGYGKGSFLDAVQIVAMFVELMDEAKWPQNCDGRDPIWWADNLTADVESAKMDIFLRGFDMDDIENLKKRLNEIKEEVQKKYEKAKIAIDVVEMYKNYKYELDKDERVVDYAKEAMEKVDIEPKLNSVRGGNDSCHLCFNGLLSTNLFVGMENMHSYGEWNSVESMEASLKNVKSLISVWMNHSA